MIGGGSYFYVESGSREGQRPENIDPLQCRILHFFDLGGYLSEARGAKRVGLLLKTGAMPFFDLTH